MRRIILDYCVSEALGEQVHGVYAVRGRDEILIATNLRIILLENDVRMASMYPTYVPYHSVMSYGNECGKGRVVALNVKEAPVVFENIQHLAGEDIISVITRKINSVDIHTSIFNRNDCNELSLLFEMIDRDKMEEKQRVKRMEVKKTAVVEYMGRVLDCEILVEMRGEKDGYNVSTKSRFGKVASGGVFYMMLAQTEGLPVHPSRNEGVIEKNSQDRVEQLYKLYEEWYKEAYIAVSP